MSAKERLKEIRDYLGLSQQKLADSIEQKPNTINNIEGGGQKEIPLELAFAIYKNHGIDLIWILYGVGEMLPKKSNSMDITYFPATEKMANWGTRLQKIQLKNELTDDQFSKIINISVKRLIKIYAENQKPDIYELLNIKENFDITLDWLLFGDDTKINNDAKKSQNTVSELGLSKDELIKLKKLLGKG